MRKRKEEKTDEVNEGLEDYSLDGEEQEEQQTDAIETNDEPDTDVQEKSCDCHKDCECHDEDCDCESCEKPSQENEYLLMAQHLQADFDNYRKRVAEQLDVQRQEGIKSVLEAFLPALDSFSEAKKSITDEVVLSGINMIESKIMDALERLNVKRIPSVGEKFDPYLHNVIAVMEDESKDQDVILQEYQSGWTLNDKVIRYSKVVVNKKGE